MSDAPDGTNILDDPAAMARADTQDMLGFVARFADQVGEGWRISRELTLPWGPPRRSRSSAWVGRPSAVTW